MEEGVSEGSAQGGREDDARPPTDAEIGGTAVTGQGRERRDCGDPDAWVCRERGEDDTVPQPTAGLGRAEATLGLAGGPAAHVQRLMGHVCLLTCSMTEVNGGRYASEHA